MTLRKRIAVAATVCAAALVAGAGAARSEGTLLTMRGAIETALTSSLDLQQAATVTRSREVSLNRSRADFLPDLRASVGGSRSYSRQGGVDESLVSDHYSSSVNMSVSSGLEIFSGFGRIASLRASRLELDAERKSFQRTTEDIIYQTMQQYVLLVLDREIIGVSESHLEAQKRLLEQVQAFVQAGIRPVVDLYQQQSSVADAENRLLSARRDYEVDRFRLLQIMGVDPGADYRVSDLDVENLSREIAALAAGPAADGAAPADSIASAAPERAIEAAMASRLDLAASRLQLEAARTQVTVSRSGYWPSVSLSANMGTSYRSSLSDRYDFSEQFDNNVSGSVGISCAIPIFDRLSTRNSTTQAKIALRQAEISHARLELQVQVELRQALENHAVAREAVTVAEAGLKYSDQALFGMEERYRVGASTLVELSQVRASNLQSAYNLVNAKYDLLLKSVSVAFYAGTLDRAVALFD